MLTSSHAIYNLALLSKKDKPNLNPYIILSAFLPDLGIVIFMLLNRDKSNLWDQVYFQDKWQIAMGLTHSLWLWPILGILTYWAYKKLDSKATRLRSDLNPKPTKSKIQNSWQKNCWMILDIIFISMTLHSLFDLPVHTQDAYRVFSPFSKWSFNSPISYYETDKFSWVINILDVVLISYLYIKVIHKNLTSKFSKILTIAFLVFSLLINLLGIIFFLNTYF